MRTLREKIAERIGVVWRERDAIREAIQILSETDVPDDILQPLNMYEQALSDDIADLKAKVDEDKDADYPYYYRDPVS